MLPLLRWSAALLVPCLLLSAPLANAQKKPPAKDKEPNSEKMISAGVLVGKVVAIYEDRRAMRLQVNVPVQKLNPGALQGVQQARLNLANARDINAMRNAQMELARAQATLYTVENQSQEVELTAKDDVIVRTNRPREAFDEKGKIRKFTKAELKELKGDDPKLPGYKADYGDIAVEQVLQVTLVKKKGAAAPRPVAKKKGKSKDEDPEAKVDLLGDNLPQVSMIVILADPPPGK